MTRIIGFWCVALGMSILFWIIGDQYVAGFFLGCATGFAFRGWDWFHELEERR